MTNLAAVKAALDSGKVSVPEMAKALHTPIRQVEDTVSGFDKNNSRVASRLAEWDIDDRAPVKKPPVAGFVEGLEVTRMIGNHVRFADQQKETVLFEGPAGSAKTETAKKLAAQHEHYIYVRIPITCRRPGQLADIFCTALNLWAPSKLHLRTSYVVEKIVGEGFTLLVDEGHLLFWEGWEWLRQIGDEAECGIAVFCQEKTLDQMRRKADGFLLDQLISRIALRVQIGPISAADVKLFCESRLGQRLDEVSLEFLNGLAQKPGRLRNLHHILNLVKKVSKGGAVEFRHFQQASAFRGISD
jgi:DNA transposition AAA+ family ATPase